MKSVAYSLTCLILLSNLHFSKQDDEGNTSTDYEPDLLEDWRIVEMELENEWQDFYDVILDGYGYLKEQAEDELKTSLSWVDDHYVNITNAYEDALYEFEQLYINNTAESDLDYEFLYDIEDTIYTNLDDLDEETRNTRDGMEDDYWTMINALDKQQDDIESILEISESRVDDIMDTSETNIIQYLDDLQQIKWEAKESEHSMSNDIDEDIQEYYEEDEDELNFAEKAALNELKNGISDVEDFDTAPSQYNSDQESEEESGEDSNDSEEAEEDEDSEAQAEEGETSESQEEDEDSEAQAEEGETSESQEEEGESSESQEEEGESSESSNDEEYKFLQSKKSEISK